MTHQVIPEAAVEAARFACIRQRQARNLSITFYSVALGLGLTAFILADGRSWVPLMLGCGTFAFATLSFLTGRASYRWAKIARPTP